MEISGRHEHRRQRAVERAIGFLLREQAAGYPEATHVLAFPRPVSSTVVVQVHRTVFFQRLLVLDTLLEASAHAWPIPADVLRSEIEGIKRARHSHVRGGWSYFPHLSDFPPDADDLAAVLHIAARVRDAELDTACDDALHLAYTSNTQQDGSVTTWILDPADRSPAAERVRRCVEVIGGRGAHIEVVANLLAGTLAYAGRRFRPEVLRGVGYLLANQSDSGHWASKWYWGNGYGSFRAVQVLRALRTGADAVRRACESLVATQDTAGGWGSSSGEVLNTAFAILTLAPEPDAVCDTAVRQARAWLLANQEVDGSWKGCPFIKMETQLGTLSYQSRTISTAFCLKALL